MFKYLSKYAAQLPIMILLLITIVTIVCGND